MANVIVVIACNLVAVLLLASGIISAMHNGIKVTLVKLSSILVGGVGAYFLTMLCSKKLYKIGGISDLFTKIGVSNGSVNSCIFLAWFLIFYAITVIACNLIRHFMIKKLRDKKANVLKMQRAKSINPSAERAVKRAEWRSLKLKYKEKIRWYHRLISGFLGAIIALVVGYVVLVPYGYIAKDIDAKKDKPHLAKGYEYTLNGLIGDTVSDFLVDVK